MNSTTIRVFLILVILTLWPLYAPSHFQKGGVDRIYYRQIPAVVCVCAAIWTLPMRELKTIEKLVLSIVVPFSSLAVSTFVVMDGLIQLRYSDQTWALWQNDERIFTNLVYYSITMLLVFGILAAYQVIQSLRAQPILP